MDLGKEREIALTMWRASRRDLGSDLANLRGVPRLVRSDENEPLISVDGAEDRVRKAHGAEGESVVRDDEIAELRAGGLECRHGGCGVDPAMRHDAFAGCNDSPAVEHELVVDTIRDGARVRLGRQLAGGLGLGQSHSEEARESFLDARQVLEDFRDGPAVGCWPLLAQLEGNTVHGRVQDDAIRVEVPQHLFGAWVHPGKLVGPWADSAGSDAGWRDPQLMLELRELPRTLGASFP